MQARFGIWETAIWGFANGSHWIYTSRVLLSGTGIKLIASFICILGIKNAPEACREDADIL